MTNKKANNEALKIDPLKDHIENVETVEVRDKMLEVLLITR